MSFYSSTSTMSTGVWNSIRVGPSQSQVGRVDITFTLLKELLGLPPEANIVSMMGNSRTGVFSIKVDSPNLDFVIEGQEIPVVSIKDIRGWDE